MSQLDWMTAKQVFSMLVAARELNYTLLHGLNATHVTYFQT
jgi:hypothetical protein